MVQAEIRRFERLAALTARIARAAAELEAARAASAVLPASAANALDELADRLQALHLVLANEVERAWNAAEAEARRARQAEILGRTHDAVSAETRVASAEVARLLSETEALNLDPHREPGNAPEDGPRGV
jgi:hypothetical protein